MTPNVSILGAGAMLALAAMVSGCNQSASAQSGLTLTGSKYCSPFKTANENSSAGLGAAPSDPAAAFDDCIHRWGYTLAPARDSADVVAQAAVDACGPIISSWSQQTMGDQGASMGPRGRQQPEPNPQAQQIRMAEARALFYVVQARAAGCQAPPANTLLSYNNSPNPNATPPNGG